MENNKLDIYLDFDDTICATREALVEHFNDKYAKGYKVGDITNPNMRGMYPFKRDCEFMDVYQTEEFFEKLKPYKGAVKFLKYVGNNYNIHVVTICSKKTEELKRAWLDELMIMCDVGDYELCPIYKEDGASKSDIDMRGGIQIDDMMSELRDTNADTKIMFDNFRQYKWNKLDEGVNHIYKMDTWDDVIQTVEFMRKHPEFIKVDEGSLFGEDVVRIPAILYC